MPTEQPRLSDEQLAYFVNCGKYDYFPELISRMMPHIKAVALKWKNVVSDTDDLVEDGVIAVFGAVKSYEKEKSSFKTFANLCVDRAILKKVKAATAGKRIPSELIFSVEESEPSVESAEDSFIRKEEEDIFASSVSSSLTALEKNVLSAFLDGNTYAQIAEGLGVSVKSVDSALQRVRNKLKK